MSTMSGAVPALMSATSLVLYGSSGDGHSANFGLTLMPFRVIRPSNWGARTLVQYQWSGWTQTGTTIVSSLGWAAATVSRGEARNISASAAAAPQVHTSHRHHIL